MCEVNKAFNSLVSGIFNERIKEWRQGLEIVFKAGLWWCDTCNRTDRAEGKVLLLHNHGPAGF